MTQSLSAPTWKLMGATSEGHPIRTLFEDASENHVRKAFISTVVDWPHDGYLYILDPEGKRAKNATHDPTGILRRNA